MDKLRNSTEWQSVPINAIKPYARHARRHSKRTIEKIKLIIGRYGQVAPIIVDPANVIVDGHAVWQAMRELGAGEIAAVVVSGRSDPEIKALRLALNRLPQEAGWINGTLRDELEELVTLSFDLDLTGFDAVEIDHVLDVDDPKLNAVEDDKVPQCLHKPVSVGGDI
jgi:ParB-like chromosome segregation protein Spo0J